jgi:hypothetical protein
MNTQIDGDRISRNILANFLCGEIKAELSSATGLVGALLFTLELEACVGVCGEHNSSSNSYGFCLEINSASQVFGEDLGCFLHLVQATRFQSRISCHYSWDPWSYIISFSAPFHNILAKPSLQSFFIFIYGASVTASVVWWSEFLAANPEVTGSIPGAPRYSE